MTTLFKNANIILPTGIVYGEVLVQDEIIAKVFSGKSTSISADNIIDLKGSYLSPGFIDIHTHGGGGADFMDGSLDSIYTACAAHLQHGTTAIIPTTITSTKQSLLSFIQLFNKAELKKPYMPEILGLHLEGPYFSYGQRGAQDEKFLRNPQPEEYNEVLQNTDRIKRWSFAVELEGSAEFLSTLNKHSIVSSVAHSDASCKEVFDAYNHGVSALTHFYSGMSGVKRVNAYRVAGVIEAGYLLDDLYCEVIADGKHLPAELLQLIYKIKGADKICLVTDSMRGAGMPDGEYILGNMSTGIKCIVEDNVAKLPDRSAFAGSVATMDRLVRTFLQLTCAPLHEVVKMASLTPARLMNIHARKGSVCPQKDADLIVFNEKIQISHVMVRGSLVKITAN